ncbi:MAG: biotin--[acetyl-CoA-carboxylase] ligase [Mariprofundaceae bacterium]|nr:biotin--[acetyl-CoA-carboxylase] ligase [Mariprofundaceae bacterium]
MHPTREALLCRLADARTPLSGATLATQLGISRTAVWKHVRALNEAGISIGAERGIGYRLDDDVLIASRLTERLAGQRIGRRCMVVDEVDSTNSALMRLAEKGLADDGEDAAPDGLVMLAERQTHGRGRLQRPWHSAARHALSMSILLRPPLSPLEVPQLSLLAAVAVQRALSPYLPGVRIKWPNDILCADRKLAGILTEMRAEPGRVQAVVIGIGLNVRPPDGGWPQDLTTIAGDVSTLSGQQHRRMDVAVAVLRELDDVYRDYLRAGFAAVRENWWQAHAASGKAVRVHDGSGYIDGIAEALDTDGALLLRTTSGLQRIIAGDLQLLEGM